MAKLGRPRIYSDEERIIRAKEYHAARYQANKAAFDARHKAYRAAKLDRMKALARARYHADLEAYRAKSAMRRADELRAAPPWLTAEHKEEIKAIYRLAKEKDLEVDHIVPLKGKSVCGLHVPWNLELLTQSENRSKGNRI